MLPTLDKAHLLNQAPPQVWKKNWVVHCQAAGQGQQVLNYLARYIFRVAISNSRLEKIEQREVTFRYRDNRSQQLRRLKLTGVEFIRRSCSTPCRAAVPRSGTTVSGVPLVAGNSSKHALCSTLLLLIQSAPQFLTRH